MSVHNEALWLDQALDSVLRQSRGDLELIVTDDGSSDDTPLILRRYAARDPRIRMTHHSSSRGLAATLNEQIALSRGRYIARMDGDDVARPDRLDKQVAFLDGHPEVGLLGSFCREIDTEGCPVALWRRPNTDQALRRALLRYNPFIHSTVMLRREVFALAGLYDQTLRYGQDYDLWLRISRHCGLANLPEPLVDLRVDLKKVARKNREARRCEFHILARHIGAGPSPAWHHVYLLRPLLWCYLSTGWMMRLKTLQRRWRRWRNAR